MFKPLGTLLLLASVLALPLAAHADTLDDFVLSGGGHTLSYSLPATTTFPDDPSVEFFLASAPTTIDGVSGYFLTGQYDAIPSQIGTMQLDVPQAIFGYPSILFQGPQLTSVVLVPSTDPNNPFDIAATFIPGTYSLEGAGMSSPFDPPGPTLPYTLTITPHDATAMTPEPSSLILLATGVFGLVGFAAIKRRRMGPAYWNAL